MINVKGFRTVTIQDMLRNENSPNIKQFFVYDAEGDIIDIYHAQANAAGGEKCLRQRLAYVTISGSKNVQKQAWTNAVWSGSAWDIS